MGGIPPFLLVSYYNTHILNLHSSLQFIILNKNSMSYFSKFISSNEVVLVLVLSLIGVAYVTIAALEKGLGRQIKKFLANFAKNLLKFLFILPFVLIFKALYICWINGVWTMPYFIQEFISNVPFLGYILYDYFGGNNSILSQDNIQNNQNIRELIFLGGLGSSLGFSLFESIFGDYFKQPVVPGPMGMVGGDFSSGGKPSIKIQIPLILKSTQDSNLNLGSDSALSNSPVQGASNAPAQGGANNTSSTYVPFWQTIIDTFNNNMVTCFEQYVNILKKMNSQNATFTLEVPKNNTDPSITQVSIAQSFFVVLKYQAEMLIQSFTGRNQWLSDLSNYLSEQDRTKIEEISAKVDKARDDYLSKVDNLTGSDPEKLRSELKQFFDFTNTYRNTAKKELAKADAIMKKGIKEHPLYEKKEIKKMINSDYPKILKAFYDQDEYLKKRIIEILNDPKRNK